MNKLMAKQLHDDYGEILSTDAGKRVLGGILFAAGLNNPVSVMDDFQRGRHDLALLIANTIREVNIYGVAECNKVFADFRKGFDDDGRADDSDAGDYVEW